MKKIIIKILSFIVVFFIMIYFLLIILSFNGIFNILFTYNFWLIIKQCFFIMLLINIPFFKKLFYKDKIIILFMLLVGFILINNINIEKKFIKFDNLESAIKYNRSRIKNAGYFITDDYVIFKNKSSYQIAYMKVNDSYFSDLYINEIKLDDYLEKDDIKFFSYDMNNNMIFNIIELKEKSSVIIDSNDNLIEYFDCQNNNYDELVFGLYVSKDSNTTIYINNIEYNLN